MNRPAVDNSMNLTLTRSFLSVILLEGDPVTLSCTPSMMGFAVLWTHNGMSVIQRADIRFSTLDLSSKLTIGKSKECDSGIYTCSAITDDGNVLVEQNITVNVLLGMKSCMIV